MTEQQDSVTNIGNRAFYNCSGFDNIVLGNQIESVGYGAFSGCSGLTEITIPSTVTSIGSSAFSDCSNLTTVNFNATNCAAMNSSSPTFDGCSLFTTYTYDQTDFETDIYDPVVDYSRRNYYGYDANFGVLFTHGGFLTGVSFDNLLQWTCPAYNQALERATRINMNVHVGKIFWLTNHMQLCPLLVYKTNIKNMNQIDIGLKYKLMSGKKIRTVYTKDENEVIIGLTYKQTLDVGNLSPLSISPMVGFTFKGITISYLCELGLTGIQRYNYGSHQIALGYRWYRDKFTSLGKHNVASMVYDF